MAVSEWRENIKCASGDPFLPGGSKMKTWKIEPSQPLICAQSVYVKHWVRKYKEDLTWNICWGLCANTCFPLQSGGSIKTNPTGFNRSLREEQASLSIWVSFIQLCFRPFFSQSAVRQALSAMVIRTKTRICCCCLRWCLIMDEALRSILWSPGSMEASKLLF